MAIASKATWFADEGFWQDFYPYMFDEKRFEDAPEQIDQILHFAQIETTDVLDLCCGPGRHSVELAARGFHVTGVDGSEFLLSKAAERAKAFGAALDLIHEDMRNFSRPDSFDLVLNLFTSFGYFENPLDDIRVLNNVYDSLRTNGIFVLDLKGKELIARTFSTTSSDMHSDGSLVVQRREICDNWTRIRNEWILIKDGTSKSYFLEHTMYSAQELMDRLRQVGFSNIRTFGELDGSPYDTNASRLVVVASKMATETQT